ncbi:hypothetical protein [Patulibacter minatonensis]|uniref:hypothetical protein n=1 Tax=Patulibacter minatonensis TaxID=298163 RepID=UPI000479F014|nr:hypothetical protein [Patulibacter minatonensis]
MPRPTTAAVVAVALLGAAVAGCGDDAGTPTGAEGAARPGATATAGAGPATTAGRPGTTAEDPATRPSTATSAGAPTTTRSVPGATTDDVAPPPRGWDATCPTATRSPMGCRAVRGRVLSIQSYDPDGDGDLHVVAIGGDVTLPGITVFDVRASLRPARDPVKGEYVTGAGPVFRGSLKQRQIQVDAFRVWRSRR